MYLSILEHSTYIGHTRSDGVKCKVPLFFKGYLPFLALVINTLSDKCKYFNRFTPSVRGSSKTRKLTLQSNIGLSPIIRPCTGVKGICRMILCTIDLPTYKHNLLFFHVDFVKVDINLDLNLQFNVNRHKCLVLQK